MVVRFLLKNQRKQNCFGFDYFLSLIQLQDTAGALSEENDSKLFAITVKQKLIPSEVTNYMPTDGLDIM